MLYVHSGPTGSIAPDLVPYNYNMQFSGSGSQMNYYETRHSSSDIYIYFPGAGELHVGDIWWNVHYSFIDDYSGATINGMIAGADRSLASATEKTLIIPGMLQLVISMSLYNSGTCLPRYGRK